MIHLITGVPGAGKTLRGVFHMLAASKKGRAIFTNIDGITDISGVHYIEPSDNPDDFFDWRTTPEGSLVIIDECQQLYPADRRGGRSQREDIAEFEIHRHKGYDFILITQHANLLHSHVRRLIGKHEHLSRAFGINAAQIYLKDSVIRTDSRTDLDSCEKELWKHDKKLFKYYKSASIHIEHKRLPRPVIYAVLGMAFMSGVVFYFYGKTDFLQNGNFNYLQENVESTEPSEQVIESTKPLLNIPQVKRAAQVPVQNSNMPPEVPMLGCISNVKTCRCYDKSGIPLFISESACRIAISKPLQTSINNFSGSGYSYRGTPPVMAQANN
ncbi:hypothetical protein BOW31_12750 [Solemya velum gill symbiont]|uniref:zonular occludens toxin domain-containing protein n=1 Tax=Solemya velum gill symbiont TaxID=2340 RepID=UPI000998AD53|nr:zonular occludens toxin domain-containing protein [Solemya velum gill symbiont]OOZ21377.1 hypothetical protein BOW31_12750 [Solemya velum gill symbiont]